VGQRRTRDIYSIESGYNWPVAHREGMPDLSGGEANFYAAVQEFNARSRNIKIIFINQFGFNRKNCGRRMPKDMEFMDIRRGSDVEFGLSIYEPFGIAQLESLTFGGICVLSSVCGCVGFVRDVSGAKEVNNIIIADYTNLESRKYPDIEDLLQIGRSERDEIEHSISGKVAGQICSRLPRNETEIATMIRTGYDLAKQMSWDIVVKNYLLVTLAKAVSKPRRQFIFL